MFNFDTAPIEAAIAYVAASAIDMRRGTAFGALVWRAEAGVLEFDGPAEYAPLIELAARRAGWVCARQVDGVCVAWRLEAAPMDEADEPEQLVLLAA